MIIIRFIKKIYWFFYKKLHGFENYLRKKGVKIGDNPNIYSDISTTESYLITIGNNVTISNGVQLVTHDNSVCKIIENVKDVFGKITIGDNCFIGAKTTILYGVTLPKNTIVAAGSVVTRSVGEEGKIIGGNPARIIGDTNNFADKMKNYAININGLSKKEKRKLIESSNFVVR